jgi:hypothetical protein
MTMFPKQGALDGLAAWRGRVTDLRVPAFFLRCLSSCGPP